MFMEKSQLQLITDITKELNMYAHKQISDLVQEKIQLEMEVLNKMAAIQKQDKEHQEKCQELIDKQSLDIVQIQERMGIDTPRPDTKLDNLVDRISDLNSQLHSRKNESHQVPRDFRLQKKKPSRRDFFMKTKAPHHSFSEDSADSALDGKRRRALRFSNFSTSLRNFGNELGFTSAC